jgi:hypothetical protein
MDMLLHKALRDCGVSLESVGKFLPTDFTIWCDPGDVSVRLGEDGSVWSLKFESGKCAVIETQQIFELALQTP